MSTRGFWQIQTCFAHDMRRPRSAVGLQCVGRLRPIVVGCGFATEPKRHTMGHFQTYCFGAGKGTFGWRTRGFWLRGCHAALLPCRSAIHQALLETSSTRSSGHHDSAKRQSVCCLFHHHHLKWSLRYAPMCSLSGVYAIWSAFVSKWPAKCSHDPKKP